MERREADNVGMKQLQAESKWYTCRINQVSEFWATEPGAYYWSGGGGTFCQRLINSLLHNNLTFNLHLSCISLTVKFSKRSIHAKLPDEDSDDNDDNRQTPAGKDVED